MARTKVRGKTQGMEEGEVPQVRELSEVLKAINKAQGEGTAIKANGRIQPQRISTGIFSLDLALCGGVPRGRMSMFHGPRSSGKTTALALCIASAQRVYPDEQAALVDPEHAYDPVWGAKLGVDNERLILVQPNTGENAVDAVDALLRAREVSLVGLDSIAALVPMKEQEKSAEDVTVGIHAKLVTNLVRRANAAYTTEGKRGHYPTLICINQQRSKIGGWSPNGDPIGLPGGKALEFFTSVQVGFKNQEKTSKDDMGQDTLEYNEHSFKIDKCKMHAGIRAGEYQLIRRPGGEFDLPEGTVDDALNMLARAKMYGVYTGAGKSWTLHLDEEYKFGKVEEAAIFLYANPEIKLELRNHLIAIHASRVGLPQSYLDYLYGMTI